MQPTDDSALLRQYAENNSDEAFAALVTRHINLVYSVALRQVGNPHHAEEITQAVFIILAKKAAQLRHDKALSSWLFQATRLTASNFVRSEARRHRREEEAYMQSVLDEAGTEVWPRIAPLLDTAVAGLREKDRQAIVLRFYEGRNLREVGLALDASEDAAEKRVGRALDKLRKFFTKRGVNSTTVIIAGAISAHSVQAAPVALAKFVTAVAIAKGAAASGSTLTLIQGALKIMAWTKAKTAIVAGVAVLLGASTTTVVMKATLFSAIKDSYFQPDYRKFQKLPDQLFVLRATHFHTPPDGINYSAETSSKSGQHATWVMGRNVSFEQLIARAYGCRQSQIVPPAIKPKNNFDYLVTMLDDQAQERLQAAIKEKLGYVASWKEHDTEVLLLKVQTPNRPGLKPGNPSKESRIWRNSQSRLEFRNRPLSAVAYEMEALANIPVRDETGLTNSFDFNLDCRQSDLVSRNWDKVNQALESLGLELVPTNMPIEMLVVEKAEQPK